MTEARRLFDKNRRVWRQAFDKGPSPASANGFRARNRWRVADDLIKAGVADDGNPPVVWLSTSPAPQWTGYRGSAVRGRCCPLPATYPCPPVPHEFTPAACASALIAIGLACRSGTAHRRRADLRA